MVTKSVAKPAGNRAKLGERAVKFIKGSWAELKKVHWPTRRELAVYTGVVLVAVFVVGVLLWIMDSLYSFIFKLIL
ncbi:MAG TPA: preprotein translocase subunit SecE [Peptococcaceae bacterium]|nr:MAG: Protein translocase subunit secE/sec61 gamma [Moorella sp. 60_41]HBT47354.1 preprotein translocase subunit SecE [Peptococcaceae bacterium]